ncbi:DUF5789 family protein [Natronobeatus ordinarius]|uniref:DUF5789 family protein n=1 Tax=Natronobeatus ordinarius TaxID=2963433 RepID=UPI0020CF6258|nr:hypothetical protein [Natronobeatus ordinarius]
MRETHTHDVDRELGIEFGDLESKLEAQEYPTTCEDLLEECGDHVVELPNGSATVGEVLGVLPTVTYESPADVRQGVFTMVGSRAIGRRYYSDRTPPALGERREDDQLSF